jgi:hypothetical protein
MRLICAILLLACTGMIQAAEDLPISARSSLEKMNKSVEQLTVAYNRALIELYAKSMSAFRHIKESETYKGNLSAAEAARAKVDKLNQMIIDLRQMTQSESNE